MTKSINTIAIVVCTVLATLFIANVVSEALRREERPFMPDALIGTWHGEEYEGTLTIGPHHIEVRKIDSKHTCNVEKVVFYYHGAFLAYLFGDQGISAVCDAESTNKYQTDMGFQAPTDYRNKYYFTPLDFNGHIRLEHSVYYEGLDEWWLDDFYRE